MKVNGIVDKNYYPTKMEETKGNKGTDKKNNNQLNQEIKDEYIPAQEEKTNLTYQKPISKPDTATIQRLMKETERNYSQLREMVRQLLEKQGLTFKNLEGLEKAVEIDDETRLKAQAIIGEGGPLSPEAVSDNIVDFAKAISGGNKDKIDMLMGAIEKGFNEAAKLLGGELPEISKKTYDLVVEKMEAWRND